MKALIVDEQEALVERLQVRVYERGEAIATAERELADAARERLMGGGM